MATEGLPLFKPELEMERARIGILSEEELMIELSKSQVRTSMLMLELEKRLYSDKLSRYED